MHETGLHNPDAGVASLGLTTKSVRYNAAEATLLESALKKNEGVLSSDGALIVNTGKFTGRSPKDKHIVREPGSEVDIWWDGNNAMEPDAFERLKADLFAYLADVDVEAQDLECGADPDHAVNVRLVSQYTWHALFLRHVLRRPARESLSGYVAEYTIVNAPGFRADPERHGCRTDTVVAMNFAQKLILIGGTEYGGENKKSAFTILNHLYPDRGILPMHCSASHGHGDPDDVAIFFGLSGTGKTTLSSDPERILIGDDEHGWSDNGVFNFEGGCYAKTINLSRAAEPEIWDATHHAGTVLENVGYDPETRHLDLTDASLTENTRAAYPISFLNNVSADGTGGTPRNVFLLTCDAFGVTPPIGLLSPTQARTLFLLGFTSKVAGTERGVTEPEPTFSTCFGAPFLTRRPEVYADMLEQRIIESGAKVWLLNTGWTGGGPTEGKRMPISATRALLRAALHGELEFSPGTVDPVWGALVPDRVPEAAQGLMAPKSTWPDPLAFDAAANNLTAMVDERLAKMNLPIETLRKVA